MHMRCALWNQETKEVVSEWQDIQMAKNDSPRMTNFVNVKEHVFMPFDGKKWTGHVATVLPGDPDTTVISGVVTHGSDLCDDPATVTFQAGRIAFGDVSDPENWPPQEMIPSGPSALANRVISAVVAYMQDNRRRPSVVYLGYKEIEDMREQAKQGTATDVKEFTYKKEFFGYRVVCVEEDSYLEVG